MSDVATCGELLGAANGGCDPVQLGAVDAGRARYDGVEADACLAAYDGGACKQATFSSPPCDAVFTGLVPLGGVCAGGERSCQPDGFCRRPTAACGGTCVAKISVGQPVTQMSDECVDGAGVAADGICRVALPLGADCGNPDGGPGAPCLPPALCVPALLTDGGMLSTCAAAIATAGELCADPAAGVAGCELGTFCDPTLIPRRCSPYVGVDGGCSAGEPCQSGLWCNTSLAPAVCQPMSATAGPCIGPDSCHRFAPCDGGTLLNPDGGLSILGDCLPLPQLGESCLGGCASGLYCDDTAKCAALKADGAICTRIAECSSRDLRLSDRSRVALRPVPLSPPPWQAVAAAVIHASCSTSTKREP